jgi:ankyrin repeat protein
LRFPFASQDCHGKTVAHVVFQNENLFEVLAKNPRFGTFPFVSPSKKADLPVGEMLKIFNVNLNCRDNQGNSVRDVILFNSKLRVAYGEPLVGLIDAFCAPRTVDVDFRINIQPPNLISAHHYKQIDKSRNKTPTSSIDIHGDTALVSHLKRAKPREGWEEGREEALQNAILELHKMGVDLNIRDKQGRTVLCVAAMHGHHACVSELLKLGAFPNSRNYQGESIIQQASAEMRASLTESQSKDYGGIVLSIHLLLDHGGVLEPTLHEEWSPPSGWLTKKIPPKTDHL